MANNILSNEEKQVSIANQVNTEVKSGVIEIYEDLLKTVWAKIVPTLGTVTVVTIMQRAISRAAQRHAVLNDLLVTDAGFDFSAIRTNLNGEDKEELKNGFKELVANLFDILAKLTGNILVQQLMKEVEGIEIP